MISDVSSRQNLIRPCRHSAALPAMHSVKIIDHHMVRIELCSTAVKALASLDPAGFGLDAVCAPLEGCTLCDGR
jgi:hypothetical protein